MAKKLGGWEKESKNIENWSERYDGFFQTLWMLQCVEYFIERGDVVQFSGKKGYASPDLKVVTQHHDDFFVECYVYSKWWFFEEFIENLLEMIDSNLCLERIHNIKVDSLSKGFENLLTEIWEVIGCQKLEEARRYASEESPYIMFRENGIQISMEGKGVTVASPNNAHGDPNYSATIYIDEIIAHKENENNLSKYKNNRLMVNGLGKDYQHIFFSKRVKRPTYTSEKIHSLEIYACGIDQKLKDCQYKFDIPKILK